MNKTTKPTKEEAPKELKGEPGLPDLSFEGLNKSLFSAWMRLGEIADKYRRIAADLEAGKAVNPKKVKKLAGSLKYWAFQLYNAGYCCLAFPGMVAKAHVKHRVAQAQAEPEQSPRGQAQGAEA